MFKLNYSCFHSFQLFATVWFNLAYEEDHFWRHWCPRRKLVFTVKAKLSYFFHFFLSTCNKIATQNKYNDSDSITHIALGKFNIKAEVSNANKCTKGMPNGKSTTQLAWKLWSMFFLNHQNINVANFSPLKLEILNPT